MLFRSIFSVAGVLEVLFTPSRAITSHVYITSSKRETSSSKRLSLSSKPVPTNSSIMPEERSVDIDTKVDWILAEYYQNINNENS